MRDLAHFGITFSVGTGTTAADSHACTIGSTATNGTELCLLTSGTGGTLREAGVVVTTAVTGSLPVITVKVRPVPGSTTNARTVDTIAVATTDVAGTVVRNVNLGANIAVNPGEQIVIELTTKSGTAGAVAPYMIFEPVYVGHREVGKTIAKPYTDVANAVGVIRNVQA